MTPEQVERVAEVLEQYARVLRYEGAISGRQDKYGYACECLALARAARDMVARYRKARKGAG